MVFFIVLGSVCDAELRTWKSRKSGVMEAAFVRK